MDFFAGFKNTAQRLINSLDEAMRAVRSSRPAASLLEDIRVDYAGARILLKELASISLQDSRTLVVTPWDKDSLLLIEKAVRETERGFSVASAGYSLRVSLPPLSEERRRELVKLVRAKTEEIRINLRRERDVVWKNIQEGAKTRTIREDEKFRLKEKLDELTHSVDEKITKFEKQKEKEIMEG